MPRILISGASGFIGNSLKNYYQGKNWEVYSLVRKKPKNSKEIFWNPEAAILNKNELEHFDLIINLAGRNIAGSLWTKNARRQILESRVKATSLLVNTINKLEFPPALVVSASAIGIYGNSSKQSDETASAGLGFLSNVCTAWESAASNLTASKLAIIRLGIVIGKDGGLCKKIIPSFKLNLGAILGTGSQSMSWISLSDTLKAIDFIYEKKLAGIFNFCAPSYCSNKEFSQALAKCLGRKIFFRIPKLFFWPLGKEFVEDFLLADQKIYPQKLLSANYHFTFDDIEEALKAELLAN